MWDFSECVIVIVIVNGSKFGLTRTLRCGCNRAQETKCLLCRASVIDAKNSFSAPAKSFIFSFTEILLGNILTCDSWTCSVVAKFFYQVCFVSSSSLGRLFNDTKQSKELFRGKIRNGLQGRPCRLVWLVSWRHVVDGAHRHR